MVLVERSDGRKGNSCFRTPTQTVRRWTLGRGPHLNGRPGSHSCPKQIEIIYYNILYSVASLMQRILYVSPRAPSHHARRLSRRSSALANTTFSSFFYHSTRWQAARKLASHSVAPEFHSRLNVVPAKSLRPAEVLTPYKLLKVYAQLSKSRLTILNVLTAMSGYAVSPLPANVPILLSTAIGTAFCSASANTLNQLQEVPFDAQMPRTRMRPLVRKAIPPLHAAAFAAVTGVAGPAILAMVNPTCAMLGLGNIILYAGLYTWSKRRTFWNTWIGSIVGGIPPLMGWTACGGQLWPSSSYPVQIFLPQILLDTPQTLSMVLIDNPLSPLALFMLLFSWQFPHFNSLSHLVRGSYAQAGYQMLSILSPSKNALVSLRHAILLVPICSVLVPLSGLTTWIYAVTTLIPNAICVRAAWRFWRMGGEKEARVVFQHSLWYLPIMFGLMMFHKQSMDWSQWLGVTGDDEEAEGEGSAVRVTRK